MITQEGYIEFKGAKVRTKVRTKKLKHSQRRVHQKTARTIWTMDKVERIESLVMNTAKKFERQEKSKARAAKRKRNNK